MKIYGRIAQEVEVQPLDLIEAIEQLALTSFKAVMLRDDFVNLETGILNKAVSFDYHKAEIEYEQLAASPEQIEVEQLRRMLKKMKQLNQ